MKDPKQTERRLAVQSVFVIFSIMTPLTWFCQWHIFKEWDHFARSILIGTCMTLFGAFAAMLASPYRGADEQRLTKVSTTIFTLVTGYVLAKIIDPLVDQIIRGASAFLDIQRSANLLIGTIGFLSGFIGTYVYRAYQGVSVFGSDLSSTPESADEKVAS